MPTVELTTTSTSAAGQSGSFTDATTGQTVNYSITGAGGAHPGYQDIDDSNIHLADGSNAETLNLSFTSEGSPILVNDVVIKWNAGNAGERLTFKVDGVLVDLNTLIASGDVSYTPTSNAFINSNGVIAHTGADVSNLEILTFNIPLSTLEIAHNGSGNGLLLEIFSDTSTEVICLARGTRIATVSGDRCIEGLVAGDLVLTMDRGYQPIRWIGSSKVPATGDLAPILIRKGALGNNRDLRVSPQHRMLLQGWQAEMLFGEQEVLATARSLVNDHSILRDEGGEVEYFHMLFDTHEIIYAEGAPSESFHPGEQGWKALDQATRDELLTLFPELADGIFQDYGASARTSLKHNEGELIGAYMVGS
ncbi:MAG: Hint domain-containing protein [Marinovum sp.]|nr:Hint domain-containing protein [Marinovum sp.]